MNQTIRVILLALWLGSGLRADYDPMHIDKVQPTQTDLMIKDVNRAREIPIRFYQPAEKAAQLWLDGDGVWSVLERDDKWQKK